MSDITKCQGFKDTGEPCPKKETCYRYKATSNPHWQAWFVASPWFNNQCEMYWEDENVVHSAGRGNNDKKSDKQQSTSDVAGQSDSEGGVDNS